MEAPEEALGCLIQIALAIGLTRSDPNHISFGHIHAGMKDERHRVPLCVHVKWDA